MEKNNINYRILIILICIIFCCCNIKKNRKPQTFIFKDIPEGIIINKILKINGFGGSKKYIIIRTENDILEIELSKYKWNYIIEGDTIISDTLR